MRVPQTLEVPDDVVVRKILQRAKAGSLSLSMIRARTPSVKSGLRAVVGHVQLHAKRLRQRLRRTPSCSCTMPTEVGQPLRIAARPLSIHSSRPIGPSDATRFFERFPAAPESPSEHFRVRRKRASQCRPTARDDRGLDVAASAEPPPHCALVRCSTSGAQPVASIACVPRPMCSASAPSCARAGHADHAP
jgi:hypothetical protein